MRQAMRGGGGGQFESLIQFGSADALREAVLRGSWKSPVEVLRYGRFQRSLVALHG
jgi:hypothetical protein